MSKQKTLSRMSLTVVALLAATLTCLAQTKSTPTRNDQTGEMKLRQPTEIAVLRSERLDIYKAEAKPASEAATFEQQRIMVRVKFQQSIDQASSAPAALLTTISESDWQKTQRLGNDQGSASPRRITFVPSRGQKLPE